MLISRHIRCHFDLTIADSPSSLPHVRSDQKDEAVVSTKHLTIPRFRGLGKDRRTKLGRVRKLAVCRD
jgi:hypothetical protein